MNASSPQISVVIPTRDRASSLQRCLESLLAQSMSDFEVIVINDGSTDDTREVLRAFSATNPTLRVHSIHHDTPRGANPSRNEAICSCRSPWIAFLDDDCYATPDWLERLSNEAVDGRIPAVTGHVENVALSNQWERFFIGQHRVVSQDRGGVRVARRIVAGNALVRREWLNDAFDEDRARVSTDVTTSARGDEEGLRIRIERAGLSIVHAPNAVVFHDHSYTFEAFCRQAFKSGQSTARLAIKYRLAPRWELCALLIAMVMLPLSTGWPLAGAVGWPALGLFLAAALWNESQFKAKSIQQIVLSFPAMFIYYLLRAIGYVTELIASFHKLPRTCKRALGRLSLVRWTHRIKEEHRVFSQHAEWKCYQDRWRESRREGRTALADRQPWLTFPAVDWLEARCFEGMRVFEWGSGGSTLFLLDRDASVTSIEHDRLWSDRVKSELGHAPTIDHRWIPAQGGSFRDYVAAIREFPDDYFDLVLIDGRARVDCLEISVSKIKPGGAILFDNAERPRYAQAVEMTRESALRDWEEILLPGPTPYFWGSHSTTIAWVRPAICYQRTTSVVANNAR